MPDQSVSWMRLNGADCMRPRDIRGMNSLVDGARRPLVPQPFRRCCQQSIPIGPSPVRHEWGTLNSFARTVSASLRGPRSSCRNGRHCADRSHRPCPCLCHRGYDNPCRRPVAVSVATEFQTNVYVVRLGDRYRWSLIHRGGPCSLLRITAMNKWTLQAGCRVWPAAGTVGDPAAAPRLRATLSTGRATGGTRGC